MQLKAVACKFYGKDLEFEPKLQYPASKVKEDATKIEAAFLAQKEFAQAWVEEHGSKHVYRGLRGEVVKEIKKQMEAGNTEIELTANVLSSWSESKDKARNFAGGGGGVILKMATQPEHVWACHAATPQFFGSHSGEFEYVMGLPGKTFKIKREDVAFV